MTSESGNSEVLSFDGEPGAAWRGKVIWVVAAVVLLGLVVGGVRLLVRPAGPLPPPEGPWPMTGEYTVMLCSGQCPAPTREQRAAIEARLRAMPQVETVEFESRQDAYDRMAREGAGLLGLPLHYLKADDMQESYRGRLRTSERAQAFTGEVGRLPGVAMARVNRTWFWKGKADVAVLLCQPPEERMEDHLMNDYRTVGDRPKDPCEGRGGVTREERDAVAARLAAIDGIRALYFADEKHSRKVRAHLDGDDDFQSAIAPPGKGNGGAAGFWIKIDDTLAVPAIRRAVTDLPGVSLVFRVADRVSFAAGPRSGGYSGV
ncbi:permease-like cell division protein FtsX [Spongiactinospora sp. 9N601]|uniref:permease-like cell division protein FtsX n=1 Tax=Spongiactinospora sp. 9N601 TaxID=3375149 RepID=UPI0037BDD105